MGERVIASPMTYNVVQTAWRTQLGDIFKVRVPDHRFLLITLSATNGGGHPVSVPFLTLEGPNREEFKELENGDGIDNWFGLLREIAPAETKQGNIAFDVPLGSYRLRLTDGGEPGTEKFVWVEIPLRIDTDTTVEMPMPGPQSFAAAPWRLGWRPHFWGRFFRLPPRFRSTALRCTNSKTDLSWARIMPSCLENPCSSVAA